GRVRELADAGRVVLARHRRVRRPVALEDEGRKRLDAGGTEREANISAAPVGVATGAQAGGAWVLLEAGGEGGVAVRGLGRELVVGAEAEVVEVVVRLDDQAAVGELRLEVQRVRRAVADLERAEERPPLRPIRANRPDAPQVMTAQALGFEGTKHDPAI